MRIVIAGSRDHDYLYKRLVFNSLDKLAGNNRITEVISGAGTGVDTYAIEWAQKRGIEYQTFEAQWGKLGKAAGPIRNVQMLNEGRPDLVVVFPGGKGTEHTFNTAKKMRKPIIQVYSNGVMSRIN